MRMNSSGNGSHNGSTHSSQGRHNNQRPPRHNSGDHNNRHSQQQQHRHIGGHPGRNHQVQNSHRLPLPKRNTVNFDPSHEPAQMRIIAAEPGLKK